ncbi:hypothetical protein QTP88_010518 [Uroleucon formosanum]
MENLLKIQSSIQVNGIEIPIRRLINTSKRIILSNVYPTIPNQLIIDALHELGIKTVSQISHMTAGFATEQFSHILSFRRQIYISQDSMSKLPSSITVTIENTTFRIFINDATTCFQCHQTGHFSSQCTNIPNTINVTEQTETEMETLIDLSSTANNIINESCPLPFANAQNANTSQDKDTSFINLSVESTNVTSLEQSVKSTLADKLISSANSNSKVKSLQTGKRPAPSTVTNSQPPSPTSSSSSLPSSPPPIVRPPNTQHGQTQSAKISKVITSKKLKTGPSSSSNDEVHTNIDEWLESTHELFNSHPDFSLTYNQFKDFLECSKGCSELGNLCIKYLSSPDNIIEIISTNYPNVTVKSAKNRLTRDNHNRASGGVATFVSSQYPSEEIPLSTNLEAVAQNSYSGKRPPVPWWNKTIKHAIRNKKTSFNKFKRTHDFHDFIEFKKNKALVRYLIKNEKKKAWEKFTTDLNSKESSTNIWKKIKIIKGIPMTQIKTILSENVILTEPQEIAQSIGQYFYSNSSDASLTNDFLKYKQEKEKYINTPTNLQPNHGQGSILNEPITLPEIELCLRGKKSKSCGSDIIPFIFLQNLPSSGKMLLLHLYNQIWETGIIPIKWKNAIITPIPKKNQNRFEPTGYRPISVLCCMSKLLEKIIYNRLNWYATQHKFLSPSQHSFRKYHSTTDCHVKIETEVIETLANKQSMILISLDLQKAYDTVWRYRVINLLKNWNIHGNMIIFLTNFLNQRSFQVKIGDLTSNTFVLENGVPQGSPLSTFLFQTAINNLPNTISNPVKSIIFADDTHLYIRGTQISEMTRILQKCLNDLSDWCFKAGFIFSPEKTKCILFSNKRKLTKPKLFLGTTCLTFVDDISILGLNFDSKLTWKSHIMALKKKRIQKP